LSQIDIGLIKDFFLIFWNKFIYFTSILLGKLWWSDGIAEIDL